MARQISDYEMSRRTAMSKAKCDLTKSISMSGHRLTALEWVNVLQEQMARMLAHGLKEEWENDDKLDSG